MQITNQMATEYITEVKRGDQSHIVELYNYIQETTKAIINKSNYCFNAAWGDEDFISDVTECIWEECMKYDADRSTFGTWLNLKASTIYIKKHNKMKEEDKMVIPSEVINDEGKEECIIDRYCSARSAEENVFDLYDCDVFENALNKLSENQRRVIKLCKLEGYKPADAAKMMNCKVEDVYRWLNRGLDKLADYLERDDLDR